MDTPAMVVSRAKLSTRFSGSVFYHVLETEELSASEEVVDRNFRDMIYPLIPATIYVHCVFDLIGRVTHPERFLINDNMWYLPEAGNMEEEIMLGVHPLEFYHPSDIELFTVQEICNGAHLRLDTDFAAYITWISCLSSPVEQLFVEFCQLLQKDD